jgi:hypothetical integral membrane protein (TIGR02206 family)
MSAANLYSWLHIWVGPGVRGALVYGSLVASCTAVVAAGRWSRRRGGEVARRMDRTIAGGLAGVYAAMLAAYLLACPVRWDTSLPIHICQLITLATPAAVLGHRRLPRAIVYFWGLGLSTQAFVHVGDIGGLTRLDTYVGWGYHEANLAAVAYDLLVRGYRPTWRDWQISAVCLTVYAILVGSLDAWLQTDYGMIGPHSHYAALALFGPWPTRIGWMLLTAIGVTGGLALVWPRNWPKLTGPIGAPTHPATL